MRGENMDKFITVKWADQTIKLKTALIGGVTDDIHACPMGMYAGSMDIGDIGLALLHNLRATIKVVKDHHDMSVDQGVDFILFCLKEAEIREIENKNIDNTSYQEHQTVLRMTKDFL
jgi:hypothetical protein